MHSVNVALVFIHIHDQYLQFCCRKVAVQRWVAEHRSANQFSKDKARLYGHSTYLLTLFLFYVHLFITSLESSNSTKSEINKNQNDSNGILF